MLRTNKVAKNLGWDVLLHEQSRPSENPSAAGQAGSYMRHNNTSQRRQHQITETISNDNNLEELKMNANDFDY